MKKTTEKRSKEKDMQGAWSLSKSSKTGERKKKNETNGASRVK